jgi:hypothetical protein
VNEATKERRAIMAKVRRERQEWQDSLHGVNDYVVRGARASLGILLDWLEKRDDRCKEITDKTAGKNRSKV